MRIGLLGIVVVVMFCTSASLAAARQHPVRMRSISLVSKPVAEEGAPEKRARKQRSVPEGRKHIPFVETAPEPVLTPRENRPGFVLFRRPIMDPVYPNTKPLPHERFNYLSAFATPGEFEPVTFSIYPVRDLKNLKVRVSPLKSRAGTIPSSAVDVRLLTYWNVAYPRYTSKDAYRRTPELLEKVTVHSSPAKECLRWWLKIHVPEDARPGLYRGTVTIWHDGYDKAVAVPLALRVLRFRLKRDPNKHYSAYYYVRNRRQYDGKDEEYVQKASANEYRAMVEYGLDMLPTLYLRSDDGKHIILRHSEEIDKMLKAGMTGPVPVTADNVISRLYRNTTPGGKRARHWKISKMPPEEFYARVTELFRQFEEERKAKGWPEFICCPMDEVHASCAEFGSRVYAAVKAAGVRTYATKNPRAPDAKLYAPHLDIWCSQPYSIPYEKAAFSKDFEYWSYPNHNAGEIKNRVVMCKGGRMTYGFGFWHSGYTTLIPWHWSWTPGSDQFDYLPATRSSGAGQRLDDDGEVIPAVYWECFREGRDDCRYIYTLQSAVVERRASTNTSCRRLVAQGRKLLDETWAAINVQQKYLDKGMWPSEEFNTRRWMLADLTERLLKYHAVRKAEVPSVLVTDTKPKAAEAGPSVIARAIASGNIESVDLGDEDFAAWKSGTAEGKVTTAPEAAHKGEKGMRFEILVDYKKDGGEGGKYPIGWPRMRADFTDAHLDLSEYDFLTFRIKVDSNRDEVADDYTPFGLTIGANEKRGERLNLGEQRVWTLVEISLKDLFGGGVAPGQLKYLQFWIGESNYAHGTKLVFDVDELCLLKLKSPVLRDVTVARYLCLPNTVLPLSIEAIGTGSVKAGDYTVRAVLRDRQGRTRAEGSQDLTTAGRMAVNAAKLKPGSYNLRVEILDSARKVCSAASRKVTLLAGPLYSR